MRAGGTLELLESGQLHQLNEKSIGISDESSRPILLRFARHRRGRRVLHLEPIGRAPRAVERVLALRHDAFQSHLARIGEDGRAVALDMLVEPDAGAGLEMRAWPRGPQADRAAGRRRSGSLFRDPGALLPGRGGAAA